MHERAIAAARFALALLLVLDLSACSEKQSPPPPAGAARNGTIVPNLSVGEIRAGMTTQDLFTVVGEPQRRTANTLDYPNLGLAVMPDRKGVVQVVMCGDVMGPEGPYAKAFKGRTPEGIGMYSTRDELLKAYGQPSESRGKPGGVEALKYETLGMIFNLNGNRIHHMVVVLRGKGQPQEPSISLDIVPTLPGEASTNQ